MRNTAKMAPQQPSAGADAVTEGARWSAARVQSSAFQSSAQPRDFASRLERISSTGNQFKRSRAIAEIADDLTALEVSTALDQMARSGYDWFEREPQGIATQLFIRWGELDPQAALQRAMTFPIRRVLSVQAVLRGWASKDALAAEAWVAAFHGPLHDAAQRGLITAIADTDPKRALALLDGLYGYPDPSLAEALFRRWTEDAPADAATHAAELRPGDLKASAMSLVAEEWANTDGASAVAWAASLPKGAGTSGNNSSPIFRTTSFPFRADPLTTSLKVWMERDADAAVAWLDHLPDAKSRNEQVRALVSMTADEDPARAAKLLEAMFPKGSEQSDALKDLVWRWGRSDPRGALAWAQEQKDEQVREVIVPNLAIDLANNYRKLSPQDTSAALALAQSLSGQAREKATRFVLSAWTAQDPEGAARWASRYPDNYSYLSGVTLPWLLRDPGAAEAWVNSFPAGPVRDQLLSLPAGDVPIDPKIGARWISQVSDPARRETAYKRLAEQWLKSDANAAREWIRSSPLSQEIKEQLLNDDAR